MSRLTEKDIENTAKALRENDGKYRALMGAGIREIAAYAVDFKGRIPAFKCAVVPVTSGQGIIGNFSETVCAILAYCGAEAYVTDKTDVAGIWQAYGRDADLIFMADDDVCAAFGTRGRIRSDNGYATGIGFAAALDLMSGSPQDVIVLGAGPVGQAAAKYLDQKGWTVFMYDPVFEKTEEALKKAPGFRVLHAPGGYKQHCHILCAANAGGIITAADVTARTHISAPGIPLGVTHKAAEIARVFHNPLELGIAVMLHHCAKQYQGVKNDRY